MKSILKQFKQLLLIAVLMLQVVIAFGQAKRHRNAFLVAHNFPYPLTDQFKAFYELTSEANVTFTFPKGFKEIEAVDDEDFSFDYAMELPGKGFEIWFQVKPQKQNYTIYHSNQHTPGKQTSNPDSAYISMGSSQASAFTGDAQPIARTIPPKVLARYNADAGKSYLLTLLDFPQTKRYKYALLIMLEKYETGTIMAVCFTNDKGPEFFKNIDRASNCLKFKNAPPQ